MQINLQIDTASEADLMALAIIAAALTGQQTTTSGSGAPVVEMEKPKADKPAKGNAPATEKPKDEKKDSGKPPTLESVRNAVITKSGDVAKKAAIKALLSEFGADKVTALDSSNYSAFLSKLENL